MGDESAYYVSSEGQPALQTPDEVAARDSALANDDEVVNLLERVAHDYEQILLETQDGEVGETDAAVFALDGTQWEELTGRVGELRDIASLSLFLTLLVVCGVAALLGGHLWRTFSEGFRR